MALVVNSNISSLNAQRQLNSSSMDLERASERLASGKRINSAADDAAGLAISNRQTSQIRGLNQAIRNANDGASLIQTAEGALEESTNILQRMRELSIQSANGIYSDADRATLDAEVQQLVAELDRISETTSFNGQKVLDGSLGSVDLQVGSEANQIISFSIAETSTKTLGLGSTTSDLSGDNISATFSIDDGDIEINGQGLSAIDLSQADENLDDLIADINNNVDGVSASAYNVFEGTGAADGVLASTDSFDIVVGSIDGSAATTFTIGGTGVTTSSLDEMVALINEKTGGAVTASIAEDSGRLVLSNDTGGTITVNNFQNGATAANVGFTSGDSQTGSLALTSDDGSAITVTKGANGTDTDLEGFGFQEIAAAGEVKGGANGTTVDGQTVDFTTALTANDLVINGVAIDASNTDTLQGKVANINAVTDETNVVASIDASESYGADLTQQVNELTLTGTLNVVATNTFDINGITVTVGATAGATATASELAADINGTANIGVTAYVDDDDQLHLYGTGPIEVTDGTVAGALSTQFIDIGGNAVADDTAEASVAATTVTTGSIKINGTEITGIDLSSVDAMLTDINAQTVTTGVTAAIDENGELEFSGTSSITLELGNTLGGATATALGISFPGASAGDNLVDPITIGATLKLDTIGGQSLSVETTANGAASTGLRSLNTDLSATVTGSAISNISVATVSGAQNAIASIDQALETINDTRSQLGAISNRLDFTVSNLSNVSENTAAARSRVVDADFASETAELSRAQVLQQASQAMLAQANARPQQVLSLLQ
ncbi:flagellin [Teredinibacter sp. KSP-S5-2]|uniref:flagellin N-terminal helical domain-containing protein n=1 Tax=Teredinibacter sp. KSP-S5-2 TaxID=3034506 RepID=UPI002934C3DC|nr:flagellin [Teredinibacter sp. KSP-S5-2]WNO07947.1 flagellin [Teredinibacter sp. KSP-S5-2]